MWRKKIYNRRSIGASAVDKAAGAFFCICTGLQLFSTGRSIYCQDRKSMIQECKIPSPQAMGFCIVTVKVLNSYTDEKAELKIK